MSTDAPMQFSDMALRPELLRALNDVGYETPSPIQAQTIPLLLEGRDVLGQAQTGTGKTAAFALPLLSRLELAAKGPQLVVLAPTRELAIQVSEAIQKYAAHLPGFQVLPIYGGQEYGGQIRALKRGVHVVVGTPGRVMDHMRRGTLKLDTLRALVLDEADEMLRMGFIDDVEWILEQTPAERQIALFSATMPTPIRRIATQHLRDPVEVTIKLKTSTAATIRQRYWMVSGVHKLDALTRILEAEPFDATIIFVRTKTATVELCEKLQARGYAAAALNGDIAQNLRERTISSLRNGKLDVLIATDVAARGLDVERVSHVINYDIPYDTEAYVHRVGRTGRAGRQGEAILFVAPREQRMLRAIERATRQPIEHMQLPSSEQINDARVARFLQRISDTLATGELGVFPQLIEQYEARHNVPARDIAAALAQMLQGEAPFLLQQPASRSAAPPRPAPEAAAAPEPPKGPFERSARKDKPARDKPTEAPAPRPERATRPAHRIGMERYRVEVGHEHQVKPGNLVGAIANETGIDGKLIGRIDIQSDHTLLDLPEGMPKEIFQLLQKVWVCGRPLKISRVGKPDGKPRERPPIGLKPRPGKARPGKRDPRK